MSSEQRKTIQINPDFLKFPMKGNKTRKAEPKPIKIRADKKKAESDKTIKRRALNLIRRMQEDKYRRLTNGQDGEATRVETVDPRKTYADEFKSDFDDSLAFLQKLTDQTQQKISANHSGTLKQYPVEPQSAIFNNSVLNQVLSENVSLEEPDVFRQAADAVISTAGPRMVLPPQPGYGCLKGGKFPTYRTYTQKMQGGGGGAEGNVPSVAASSGERLGMANGTPNPSTGGSKNLSPEQQRAELKQFLNKKSEEKKRVEQIKRQRNIANPRKHQRRKTTRTFRVGKSKFYPRVGVLIPNKTIRTQVLAKKQKIRETPTEDMRKHLIKKGLIRVGSSCPTDVLRQMYESSMMMCGEIQNHNPDNLLFNYLNNAL
jgi:hypothetical protein